MADELTPLTRIENFLAGNPQELEPLTRIEQFLANMGGGIELNDGTLDIEVVGDEQNWDINYQYAHLDKVYFVYIDMTQYVPAVASEPGRDLFRIVGKRIAADNYLIAPLMRLHKLQLSQTIYLRFISPRKAARLYLI